MGLLKSCCLTAYIVTVVMTVSLCCLFVKDWEELQEKLKQVEEDA